MSKKDIEKYINFCDKYISTLSQQDIELLQSYQNMGGYRYFNEAIVRNFSGPGDMTALRDTILMDQILSQSPTLPPNIVLYRGLRNKGCADMYNYKVGDLIYNKSLMSTSLSPKVSRNFLIPKPLDNPSFKKYKCFLTITMPDDTRNIHGLYIENLPVSSSGKTYESEILFPTGLAVQIVSIEQQGDVKIFHTVCAFCNISDRHKGKENPFVLLKKIPKRGTDMQRKIENKKDVEIKNIGEKYKVGELQQLSIQQLKSILKDHGGIPRGPLLKSKAISTILERQ